MTTRSTFLTTNAIDSNPPWCSSLGLFPSTDQRLSRVQQFRQSHPSIRAWTEPQEAVLTKELEDQSARLGAAVVASLAHLSGTDKAQGGLQCPYAFDDVTRSSAVVASHAHPSNS